MFYVPFIESNIVRQKKNGDNPKIQNDVPIVKQQQIAKTDPTLIKRSVQTSGIEDNNTYYRNDGKVAKN